MILTLEQAQEKIKSYNKGHFFSVHFIKRTNNEYRKMVCRKGVKKFVKGIGAGYNFSEKLLVSVWDTHKKEYRVINLETIKYLKIDGKEIKVIQN